MDNKVRERESEKKKEQISTKRSFEDGRRVIGARSGMRVEKHTNTKKKKRCTVTHTLYSLLSSSNQKIKKAIIKSYKKENRVNANKHTHTQTLQSES